MRADSDTPPRGSGSAQPPGTPPLVPPGDGGGGAGADGSGPGGGGTLPDLSKGSGELSGGGGFLSNATRGFWSLATNTAFRKIFPGAQNSIAQAGQNIGAAFGSLFGPAGTFAGNIFGRAMGEIINQIPGIGTSGPKLHEVAARMTFDMNSGEVTSPKGSWGVRNLYGDDAANTFTDTIQASAAFSDAAIQKLGLREGGPGGRNNIRMSIQGNRILLTRQDLPGNRSKGENPTLATWGSGSKVSGVPSLTNVKDAVERLNYERVYAAAINTGGTWGDALRNYEDKLSSGKSDARVYGPRTQSGVDIDGKRDFAGLVNALATWDTDKRGYFDRKISELDSSLPQSERDAWAWYYNRQAAI